jgi:hypothetical protein
VNERRVLILTSAIAAWCVSNTAVIFAKAMGWVRPGDLEFSTAQARIALPAMLAVALSVWWCTEKWIFKREHHLLTAAFITAFSYPALAPCVFFFLLVFGSIEGTLNASSYVEYLQGAIISSALIVIPAFIVTVLPAFAAEYAVVRLVRASWMRGLLSGVDP